MNEPAADLQQREAVQNSPESEAREHLQLPGS